MAMKLPSGEGNVHFAVSISCFFDIFILSLFLCSSGGKVNAFRLSRFLLPFSFYKRFIRFRLIVDLNVIVVERVV